MKYGKWRKPGIRGPAFWPKVVFILLASAATVVIAGPTSYAAGTEETGKVLFAEKCGSCHTIGGGRKVGPDLSDITGKRDQDWLVQYIAFPDRMIAQGDPIATKLLDEYGFPMPNVGVSTEEASSILMYIETLSAPAPTGAMTPTVIVPTQSNEGRTATGTASSVTTTLPSSTKPPPNVLEGLTSPPPETAYPDVDAGRDIFTGRMPMQNGGAACMSCHSVSSIGGAGGGTMASDLTNAYSRFGEQGMIAVLKSMPFPIMRETGRDKPLTNEEIVNLTAFLKEVDQSGRESVSTFGLYVGASIAGFLFVLVILSLIWRQRFFGVRRQIVRGGSR